MYEVYYLLKHVKLIYHIILYYIAIMIEIA